MSRRPRRLNMPPSRRRPALPGPAPGRGAGQSLRSPAPKELPPPEEAPLPRPAAPPRRRRGWFSPIMPGYLVFDFLAVA
ncbi:MAG: LytR family transcriptional regulator, partial [Nitrospinota bacterium]